MDDDKKCCSAGRPNDWGSRWQMLERLAASASKYSPELLHMLQQERAILTMQLINTLMQSMRAQTESCLVEPAGPVPYRPCQVARLCPTSLASQAPMWSLAAVPTYSATLIDPRSLNIPLIQARDHRVVPPCGPIQQLSYQCTLSTSPILTQHMMATGVASYPFCDGEPPKLFEKGLGSGRPIRILEEAIDNGKPTGRIRQTQSISVPNPPDGTRDRTNADGHVCSHGQDTHRNHVKQACQSNQTPSTDILPVKCVKRRRYRAETFPPKLFRMIEYAKEMDLEHLICFTADGMAIHLGSSQALTEQIISKFFRHSKFPSFLRQLSMYGWVRLTDGPNKGAYSHQFFMKGRSDLLAYIKRVSELEPE